MDESLQNPMLLVTPDDALPGNSRIWGSGTWLPPDKREALDWLTLARLLGWGVRVGRLTDGRVNLSTGIGWITVAAEPDSLDESFVNLLESYTEAEPVLVVARAGSSRSPFSRFAGAARDASTVAGMQVSWKGPGLKRDWNWSQSVTARRLRVSEGVSTWAAMNGAPLIVARQVGRGFIATLSFHPSELRDAEGAGTSLLKHLLIFGSPKPVAWLDLHGTLVLRMDDAGGSQNVYLKSWCYPKLREEDWVDLGIDLAQQGARISIGYIPGWVDDGDAGRGRLEVSGAEAARLPGAVFPSPLVRYQDRSGHAPGTVYDYESEFRGIQSLRTAGLGDVELHGYTHTCPDVTRWARAHDRYENESWYSDFRSGMSDGRALDRQHLARGFRTLCECFRTRPTTLVCPQHSYTADALEEALDLGLHFIAAWRLAVRDDGRFCWVTHVRTAHFATKSRNAFSSELPVVAILHDRGLATYGQYWMRKWLDVWRLAGAQRFWDYRELAAAVGCRLRLDESDGIPRLTIVRDESMPLVRPLRVGLYLPGKSAAPCVEARINQQSLFLPADSLANYSLRVTVPVV